MQLSNKVNIDTHQQVIQDVDLKKKGEFVTIYFSVELGQSPNKS